MNILGVSFYAYNRKVNHFALCVILINKDAFGISKIYNISVAQDYFICSEIKIEKLDQLDENENGVFPDLYRLAEKQGFSFLAFPDEGNLNMSLINVPRFGEADFEGIINSMGGSKISETENRTPDFFINNILLELKDLQEDSLENKDRQKRISELFKGIGEYAINIDPLLDFGDLTFDYHRLIKKTIKNRFNSASDQIKQYKKLNANFKNAGIIILNTGFESLPHELLKKMVTDILNNETKTIEFAFLFSQKMQTNGWNMDSVFLSEWVGNVPNEILKLKDEMNELVEIKMIEMVRENNSSKTIESQKPISFEIDNKVFFWNPGQMKFPWE